MTRQDGTFSVEDLSNKIRLLCRSKGITITQLERELGFGNGVISRWGKNVSSPSSDRVLAIARYFGVSLDYLCSCSVDSSGSTAKPSKTINGARLSSRRKALGLTLDDLAGAIGISRSTVCRYENGTIELLKLPVIDTLARILSVSPAWLIGASDDPGVDDSSSPRSNFLELYDSLSPDNQRMLLAFALTLKKQEEEAE